MPTYDELLGKRSSQGYDGIFGAVSEGKEVDKTGFPFAGYYISAYGIAVKHGYTGTETEWLESLKGRDYYAVAVLNGYEGTREELDALIVDAATARDSAAGSAAEAGNAAEAAEDAAETAVAAKNEAVSSKNAASQSAAGALSSAQSASQSAGNAALSAQSAANAMNAAGESAAAAEAAADTAVEAKEAIEDMTVSAETLPAGSAASVTKSIVSDVAHLIFGIPKGADSDMIAAVYDPAGGAKQVAFEDDLTAHTGNTGNPHNVTKAQVGLGNVPNVATNDQTPTYTEADTLAALTSGEKLSVAFGKLKKAVSDLISHLGDTVKHITAAERTSWNAKQNALTFDTTPTESSTNPVTSDGVKSYVDDSYTIAGQRSGATLGTKATAEGNQNTASGNYSHAEGSHTTASGNISHAEGDLTIASGKTSHAEGRATEASGDYSHAEGSHTTASGDNSHAEGDHTTASGGASHAEGYQTEAFGNVSHAEGNYTTAYGLYSHAEGDHTTTDRKSQHVFGEYNAPDTTGSPTTRGQYVEIVGNGTSGSARSNARTLDWSGNETLAGKLTLGAAPTADMDAATKQYVDGAISAAIGNAIGGSY